MAAATGRLALRTGAVLIAVGGFIFIVGIVIHTIMAVFTLLLLAVVVAAVLGAWGRARRPRTR